MQSNLNLINGRFITLDGNDDNIQSLTIENGKIKGFNSPNSNFQTIDLNNNIVIPGFIDSHFHLKNSLRKKSLHMGTNFYQNNSPKKRIPSYGTKFFL